MTGKMEAARALTICRSATNHRKILITRTIRMVRITTVAVEELVAGDGVRWFCFLKKNGFVGGRVGPWVSLVTGLRCLGGLGRAGCGSVGVGVGVGGVCA